MAPPLVDGVGQETMTWWLPASAVTGTGGPGGPVCCCWLPGLGSVRPLPGLGFLALDCGAGAAMTDRSPLLPARLDWYLSTMRVTPLGSTTRATLESGALIM